MPQPTNRNSMLRSVLVLLAGMSIVAAIPAVVVAAPFNDETKTELAPNNRQPVPPPAHADINEPPKPKLFPKPSETGVSPPPPTLNDLEEQTEGEEGAKGELGLQIRADAT